MEKKTTALRLLITMIERGQPIMPDTKKQLIELEKLQLIQAYQLDPELMEVRFKNGSDWFNKTYEN